MRYDPTHNNIIIKIDGKTEVIDIPTDPIQVFQTMMRIFRESMGMMSSRDLVVQKDEMESARQQRQVDLDCDWKKIKPKSLKNQLLSDFVWRLRDKYGLTNAEVKKLFSVIHIGFQFHSLTGDGVNYSRGKIRSIEGLTFNPKTRTFSVPEFSVGTSKSDKVVPSSRLYTMVDKYLREQVTRKLRLK